jgi:hypothetical protein
MIEPQEQSEMDRKAYVVGDLNNPMALGQDGLPFNQMASTG